MSDEEKTKWVLNYTRAMQQEMSERTDWGDLLEREEQEPQASEESSFWRWPDW